ncbi:MAG: phosphate acetyltransferase, partial [Pseudomonadota bacterium]|nr:phosphate acetyltransferase [Pseudomonadota bacterium]
MSCNLVIIPTEQGVGSSAIRLGIKHALEQHGYSVTNFHPFNDSKITPQKLQSYFLEDRRQDLLEDIMKEFEPFQVKADFVLVEGIYTKLSQSSELAWFSHHVDWFNAALVRAIMGNVIFVTRPTSNNLAQLEEQITLATNDFSPEFILGALVTKLNAPINDDGEIKFSLIDEADEHQLNITHEQIAQLKIFTDNKIKLLGTTIWNKEMTQPRISDLMQALNIHPLIEGGDTTRRIKQISLCSRGINNLVSDLQAGTLLITAIDRADIIMAASLAEARGIKLAGLLLTADYSVPQETMWFCYADANNNLPIYANQDHRKTLNFILAMKDLDLKSVPSDDLERLELIKREISECVDIGAIEAKLNHQVTKKMSPAAFRYMLIKKAQAAHKRIVLPEGEEPRTLKAAIHCQEKGIADCVLLGNIDKIHQLAKANGLTIPSNMQIIDPQDVAAAYVNQLVELRKSKGMTSEQALDILTSDVNYLGTMMIYNGEVAGLVSGAENTTAATVRPALQIVKTKPGSSLVSSVFFMCLEDQVLLYGDCAINPDPNAEELADIAIQSADTATQFNIEPRVAMISYSTGSSGQGADVEKVKAATAIVRIKRPDILIDGPLQYDAAMIKEIGEKKAPNSPVAGRATVCIFPDLNTGNTTYKAVQRSANVLSIGPLLQGLNKPVNDLSRGATVDDIIYTIAITAVQ